MLALQKKRRYKRWIITGLIIASILIGLSLLLANRFVEPMLRDRLETLIIRGSDSLYTYELGDLKANFFGGNVEVENLQIRIDSNRYYQLKRRNALPPLTMHLDLQRGYIKGLGVFSLLFGKEIDIKELGSRQADIKLSRHIRAKDTLPRENIPLWKAIQPQINNIDIGRIKLDGLKMLYRNADTSEAIKLQFDRFDAAFNDVRIDSTSAYDTSRIGFVKNFSIRFNDIKFRTPDSSTKMKAEWINYSSETRILEIEDFKVQPMLKEKEDFYKAVGSQKAMEVIEFDKLRLSGLRLERFIHNNILEADSLIVQKPQISIYVDRSMPPKFESKVGKYPHQQLLRADASINIKHFTISDADLEYTEKNPKTMQEGTLVLKDVSVTAQNVTNDYYAIARNPFCNAQLKGKILETTPLEVNFKFYLDSTNGRFDASGTVGAANASQLNKLALPLANVQLQSLNVQSLQFNLTGEDFEMRGNVRMLYNNLSLVLRKTDEETGETKTNKFLTKVLRKFVINPSNPGADGVERTSTNIRVMRLTDKAFFGLIWQAIFAGMQDIMMKSGRYS
jgi:hypothetical protein